MRVRRLSQSLLHLWLHFDLLQERHQLDDHQDQPNGVCSRELYPRPAAHRAVSVLTQQATDLNRTASLPGTRAGITRFGLSRRRRDRKFPLLEGFASPARVMRYGNIRSKRYSTPVAPSRATVTARARRNWLREAEIMQRHSQYIVSKPVVKSSKDKQKKKKKMRLPIDELVMKGGQIQSGNMIVVVDGGGGLGIPGSFFLNTQSVIECTDCANLAS
ncbi:hypothetical protein BDZ89DRAFT_1041481 [Hymenopellis radicata]|nr:hypothetical protein BDZ89DRAFT_1041481 [Hymenopellis radicata]